MKHLNKFLVTVLMVSGLTSQAQDGNNPWAVSFGVNAVDTRVSAGGHKGFLDNSISQAFKVKDNWNILPSISYIGVARSVGNNFSVGVQGSVNKIEKFVKYTGGNYVTSNPGDLMYYGVDGAVKYSFMNAIKSKVIDPNLSLGGGYTFLGDSSFGTINLGAGVNFWFSDVVGLSVGTTYKGASILGGDRVDGGGVPDAPGHFLHSVGLTFKFGGKDTDGDGIYDKQDACPDVKGLKQFNGCPDTDGDGIADKDDACPDVAGIAALNGCPDADGDGVTDADDACPKEAGLKALKGCPDADGDGIADKDDKCPKVKGEKANGGCPWPDTDNDGVLDKDDECPNVAGPKSNKGCPEVTAEVLQSIKMEARSVFFNSGQSTFKSSDVPVRLDAITNIIKKYPNAKFSIEGHTDSDGSDASNQKLSEDRANAVKDALIERGVKASNLSAVGFGETKPVATNKTAAGKAQNRRTEVILVK
ncbi:OmpA family protein [Flavobacterium ovatum]|uniref:OmpA family protein n=1 Tax=Flavobacterium ovatum TaxID=1928857 RepID=UPI00344F3D6F